MQVNYPIFVRAKDSGEIEKFDSVHELQVRVEKIDIENKEYEAWDKDGSRVELNLQDPVWIMLEPSSPGHESHGLRDALLDYAKSVGIQVSNQLPVAAFETVLGQIRREQEKKILANSPARRFFARFKRPTQS